MTQPTAPQPPHFKTLVVGAGAAGIAAAMWLHELGAPFEWVEAADKSGGTLLRVHNPIHNYPGARFEHGAACAAAMRQDFERRALAPRYNTRATQVRADQTGVSVTLQSPDAAHEARFGAVIVATGTQRRRLGLPEETAHLGRGVAVSGRAERERFRGRKVTIVGAGDAAFENALLLAEVGATVTMINRSAAFRARDEFVVPAQNHPAITILNHSRLRSIEATDGAPFLTAVVVETKDKPLQTLPTEGLLVRIGEGATVPPIELEGGRAAPTTGYGYLMADTQAQAGHPRVLAAGDCACPTFRTIALASGQGSQAAYSAARLLGFV